MCTWARRVFGTLQASNPPDLAEVLPTAPGEGPVWVGDHSLPPEQQGFVVLGTPFGSEAFKKEALRNKALNHGRLLDRIPSLPDLQSGVVATTNVCRATL